jgi:hypothetical protein
MEKQAFMRPLPNYEENKFSTDAARDSTVTWTDNWGVNGFSTMESF